MNLSVTLIGFFFGFTFGIGCALAVLYSIYMGGYRAAVRESLLPEPPERLTQARAKAFQKQTAVSTTRD